MNIETQSDYSRHDYRYSEEATPEDVIRADTTIIRNSLEFIPMYQKGIGINGFPIDISRAQTLTDSYYELLLSALNRSGKSLDPVLVERAYETILDSSLSL